jgi:hypothetical protein
MTTPSVTELPPGLEAVEPDPFIETLPRPLDLDAARHDRKLRERRLERVRRLMRMRATRNGRTARATDRV